MTHQHTILGGTEPVLVSAKRLAELLRVSEVTINNYRSKSGMPAEMRDGKWRYALDVCTAWHRKFVASDPGAHGGERKGAGRPRGKANGKANRKADDKSTSQQPSLREAAVQAAVGEGGGGVGGGVGGGGVGGDDVSMQGEALTPESILALVQSGKMNLAKATMALRVAQASAELSDLAESMGKTMLVEDAEEAWAGHISSVTSVLRTLPAKCASELRLIFGLDAKQSQRVQEVVELEVQRAMTLVAENPLGVKQESEGEE